MIDKKIKFDERYDDGEGMTTLYFTAPKELLDGDYPEAVSMEISVELPTDKMEAKYADVSLSPTRYIEEDDSYEDYDWYDVVMSYEDIEELIDLAKKSDKFNVIY